VIFMAFGDFLTRHSNKKEEPRLFLSSCMKPVDQLQS